MVRAAKFTDIPQIIGLLHTCHQSSKYNHGEVDVPEAKRLLLGAIASHQTEPTMGQTPVFVSGGDDLTGVIVGCLKPVHFAVNIAMVTDLMWYVDPKKASPRDGDDLITTLHEWADRFPAPVKKLHIVTDAVMNPNVLARKFRQDGYNMSGYIFEKEAG